MRPAPDAVVIDTSAMDIDAAVAAAIPIVGPLIGGAMYAISPTVLGLVGGGIMLTASFLMIYVEWRIRPQVLSHLVRS